MLFRQVRNGYFVRAVVILLLSLVATQVRAAESKNLYQVWVPVADQGSASREVAFQQAFDGVVRKLTGRDDVATMAGLSKPRTRAATYVNQYHYQERSGGGRMASEEKYLLQVRFSEAAINQLLRQNDLPLWGGGRPSLLIWIAQDNHEGQRTIISPQDLSIIRDDMAVAAHNWGIPVLYPLIDFEDSNALSISELWGLFQEPVQRASSRYGANAVLAMRVWPAGEDSWNGRTLFLLNGQAYSQTYEKMQPIALANAVTAEVAKRMAAVFAVSAGTAPEQPAHIMVENVKSVRAYAGLMKYLEGLTAVRSAVPVQVDSSRILLSVAIDGTLQQFDHALESGRRLRSIPTPADINVINHAYVQQADVQKVPLEVLETVPGAVIEERDTPFSEIGTPAVEIPELDWTADLYYRWQ